MTASSPKHVNDSVHWYLNDLTSRIVAESGRPSDRFHMGKLLLQSFKEDPDFVMQIDGGTDEHETSSSTLKRTVRCALALKNFGLQCGDVIILTAPNHIDLAIPLYAALYLGITVAAVDRTLGVKELKGTFEVDGPKLIFCQSEKAPDIQLALNELDQNTPIVTFDKGDYMLSFEEFMEKYGEDMDVEDFRAADFNPEDTTALFIATSGTTGLPKAAVVTHKSLATTTPYLWSRYSKFPTPTKMALITSPLQWLSALMNFIVSPIFRYTRLQSSLPVTPEFAVELINKYKPTFTIFSPTFMTTLLKPGEREKCDFTCFELILLGGSAVPQVLIDEIKEISPNTDVYSIYGMSELTTLGFHAEYPASGSCGKRIGCFQYRLINVGTQEDILDPNVPGELWIKGPGLFKEYYKNPAATEETFAEDRWFKTGDTFYRDENWNYFFVERIKLLLKYKSYQISPVEIESLIHEHPGVLDVAVTGIPDPECGDLPVAFVVRRPGHDVTAEDIKNFVKDSLSDAKQLRGGVIFVDDIPVTASTKVHRRKIKELALVMDRE